MVRDDACWNVNLVLTTRQDERDNKIGTANRDNVRGFLSSLAIYPFSNSYKHNSRYGPWLTGHLAERLGMTVNEAQLLIAQARNEADNPAFRVSFQQSNLGEKY